MQTAVLGNENKYDITAPKFKTAFAFLKRSDLAKLADGWYDHMCINERLYGGYEDTIDLIHIRIAYIVLLNMVLIMEQIVVIRAFLLRNRKTFYLLEAMGMTRRERRRIFPFRSWNRFWNMGIR